MDEKRVRGQRRHLPQPLVRTQPAMAPTHGAVRTDHTATEQPSIACQLVVARARAGRSTTGVCTNELWRTPSGKAPSVTWPQQPQAKRWRRDSVIATRGSEISLTWWRSRSGSVPRRG